MLALLNLLLVLAPVPRDRQPVQHPLIGHNIMVWGSIYQHCRWDADGTYDCPQFRGTTWATDEDGIIWFYENDGQSLYGMRIDWRISEGTGWRWDQEQGPCSEVRVKIVPRELLKMPREVPEP